MFVTVCARCVCVKVLAGNPLVSPPFDALFHLSLLTSLDLSKCQLATLHTLQFVSQVRVWVRSMGPVLSSRQGACRSMLCCAATNLLCPCASLSLAALCS